MAQYLLKSYSVPPLSGVWTDVLISQTVYTYYQDCVIPKPTVNFHAVWDGKISSMTLTRKTGATGRAVAYIQFGDASDVVRWSVRPGQTAYSDHWRGESAAAIGKRTGALNNWTTGDIAKVRLRFDFNVGGGCDVGITVAASQVHIYSEC